MTGKPTSMGGDGGAVARSISLGCGKRVPYPTPTSQVATKIGKSNRRTGTKPEVALRSALHGRGLRFRKDHAIPFDSFRVKPDVVFTRAKLAVFVDGCFWHCCAEHGVKPTQNRAYWEPKLAANVARDRRADEALRAAGWTVVRVWEHEQLTEVAARVEKLAVDLRQRLRT